MTNVISVSTFWKVLSYYIRSVSPSLSLSLSMSTSSTLSTFGELLWYQWSYWRYFQLPLPSFRYLAHLKLPLAPVTFFPFILLLSMLPVMGGLSPLLQLNRSIIPLNRFPNQRVPCSCLVTLGIFHVVLFFIFLHYSFTFLMIQSCTIMGVIFPIFSNFPEFSKNTFWFPFMFTVGPSEIHSWVLWVMFLFIFGLSWASK